MGTTSGDKSRFSDMIMAASAAVVAKEKKASTSGRVDMVSKIDLSVKLDEDSVDEDEEMESSEDVAPLQMASVKDEENTSSPGRHENQQHHGFRDTTLELATSQHRSNTASERSTVEDVDSRPSSPAGLSASAANQLTNEVLIQSSFSSRAGYKQFFFLTWSVFHEDS